jgi:hypothetical protein
MHYFSFIERSASKRHKMPTSGYYNTSKFQKLAVNEYCRVSSYLLMRRVTRDGQKKICIGDVGTKTI